jgi:hypothetical protein
MKKTFVVKLRFATEVAAQEYLSYMGSSVFGSVADGLAERDPKIVEEWE